MKRVVLVHGWEGTPEKDWFPWLKKELENRNIKVIAPQLPDTNTPTFKKSVPFLLNLIKNPDSETYFVAHSLGCITTLRYLEAFKKNQKVGGVILVAGFGHDLEYEGYKYKLSSFFEKPINWGEIKEHSSRFVIIYSDDDPWVAPKYALELRDKLDGTILPQEKMGHFNYPELAIVGDILLKMMREK